MARPTSTGSRKSRLRLAAVLAAVAVGVVAALAGAAFADQVNGDSDTLTAAVQSDPVVVTLAPGGSTDVIVGVEVKSTGSTHATFPVSVTASSSGSTIGTPNPTSLSVTDYGDPGEATTTVHITAPTTGLTCGANNVFHPSVTFTTSASGFNQNTDSVNFNVNVPGPTCAPSDTTPPTVNVATDNTVPTSGWFTTSPQQVDVSAYDNASGVTNIQCNVDGGGYADASSQSGDGTSATSLRTGTVSVSGDGTHTVVCQATDGASPPNTGTSSTLTVKIDTTPPSLSLSVTESDAYDYVDTATNTLYYNDQGTHTGSFTVTGTASDSASGIDKVSFPNVFTASDGGDTTGPYSDTYNWTATENVSGSQTVTAYNGAGLTTTADLTVTRDVTAPTISVTGFTDGAIYHPGDTLPTVGCSTASDTGSGVASQSGPTVKTGTGLVNGLGTVTYQCTATDNVANSYTAESTYSVIYNFTGFFQPVDNPPTCNTVKAGQAIPVKFSLDGYQGMSIFAEGYPKATGGTCPTNDTSAIDETVAASQSGLNYDATADQYIYVWKTDKAWAGKAILLTVKLADGTTHTARFAFTR